MYKREWKFHIIEMCEFHERRKIKSELKWKDTLKIHCTFHTTNPLKSFWFFRKSQNEQIIMCTVSNFHLQQESKQMRKRERQRKGNMLRILPKLIHWEPKIIINGTCGYVRACCVFCTIIFLCSFSTENFKSSYHSYPFTIPQLFVSFSTVSEWWVVYACVHECSC